MSDELRLARQRLLGTVCRAEQLFKGLPRTSVPVPDTAWKLFWLPGPSALRVQLPEAPHVALSEIVDVHFIKVAVGLIPDLYVACVARGLALGDELEQIETANSELLAWVRQGEEQVKRW